MALTFMPPLANEAGQIYVWQTFRRYYDSVFSVLDETRSRHPEVPAPELTPK